MKATHNIYNKRGELLYLYDVKSHKVFTTKGEYYTTMGQGFTDTCLRNDSPSYNFKRINIQLENK